MAVRAYRRHHVVYCLPFIQFFATGADKTPQTGWIAKHQTMIRHIASYDTTRTNHGPFANGNPATDGGIGTQHGHMDPNKDNNEEIIQFITKNKIDAIYYLPE